VKGTLPDNAHGMQLRSAWKAQVGGRRCDPRTENLRICVPGVSLRPHPTSHVPMPDWQHSHRHSRTREDFDGLAHSASEPDLTDAQSVASLALATCCLHRRAGTTLCSAGSNWAVRRHAIRQDGLSLERDHLTVTSLSLLVVSVRHTGEHSILPRLESDMPISITRHSLTAILAALISTTMACVLPATLRAQSGNQGDGHGLHHDWYRDLKIRLVVLQRR
jgi:hypothetical protein